MSANVIIPDLPLDGLKIAALVHLLEFVEPIGAQFDSASMDKKYPFTIPSTRHPGAVEETPIGEIVSAISLWGDRQTERIIQALRNAPYEGASEALWRGLALIRADIEQHEWQSAQVTIGEFIAEDERRHGKAVR